MHEAFVLIVVNAIRERYVSEKAFYTEELGISGQSWTRWKNGERGLKAENLQKNRAPIYGLRVDARQ